MRYNFKRCSGSEWVATIDSIRTRGIAFLEVERSEDLFNPEKVDKVWYAYYYRTTTSCRLIYYDFDGIKFKKKLREISFSRKDIDPVRCVLTFRKIAKSYDELIDYEPNKYYTNGIYTYYTKPYKGYVTVLDMNSAYLWALQQPLADWTTREECSFEDVRSMKYDYYCFENDIHCEMFYKENYLGMLGAYCWADVKIYGYKSKVHYKQTAQELYRLKTQVDKEKYKNIANIAVGCMHKHSGKQNNTTLAASLYAYFEWYIDSLVAKFEEKGYNVIMVTTDSVKIKGKYNRDDNIVSIGDGLGEFKVEYEGDAEYISQGHYTEQEVRWKGKPQYMIDGYKKCKFVEDIEDEVEVYEKYAIK